MSCKVVIHFIGGEELILNNQEIDGDSYQEKMQSFINENDFANSEFFAIHYTDDSLMIRRDSISYIEIKEQ